MDILLRMNSDDSDTIIVKCLTDKGITALERNSSGDKVEIGEEISTDIPLMDLLELLYPAEIGLHDNETGKALLIAPDLH